MLSDRIDRFLLLFAQNPMKHCFNRLSGEALVTHLRLDLEGLKQLDYIRQAPARQRQMFAKILSAADDARFVECGQPHGLRLIELRILEGSYSQDPIHQCWRQALLLDVNQTGTDDRNSGRQGPFDRFLNSPVRWRQCPRIRLIIIRDAQADADQIAMFLRFEDQPLRVCLGHSSQRRKIGPLVRIRLEVRVEELSVVFGSRAFLQRQCDQVAEAALGHGVLIREETVVGIEAKLMTAFHRARQQQRPKLARNHSGHRPLKEDPYMPTFSGARSFQCRGHVAVMARLQERRSVFLPGLLVKVDGKEPTGFIAKQRVDAESLLAREMIVDRLLGERNVLPSIFVDSLPILNAGGVVGLPVALRNGRVAAVPVGAFPTQCIDVFTTAEQRTEKSDLLRGC